MSVCPANQPLPVRTRYRGLSFLFLLLIISMVTIVPTSSATLIELGNKDGTFTGDVVSGEFVAYRMEGLGDKDSLSFSLTVTDDVQDEEYLVDVYLFTQKSFAEYIDDSYRHTFALLKESRTTVALFDYAKKSDNLVFVIDNTDIASGEADPEGVVHYNLVIKRVDYLFPWLIWLLLILFILILMFLITYRVLRKRRYNRGRASYLQSQRRNRPVDITREKVTTTTGADGVVRTNRSFSKQRMNGKESSETLPYMRDGY